MQKLATAATAMATAMATAAIMASAAHAGDTDPPANTTTTATTNTAPAADPVAAAKKDFDFVLAGGYAHFFDMGYRLYGDRRYLRIVRDAERGFDALLWGSSAAGEGVVKQALTAFDSAATKGVIHKNTAARRKSRLMKRLNAATGAA